MIIDKLGRFDKVDRYEIIEVLGQGSTGVIYKARDPLLQRLVVLKVLDTGPRGDSELLTRFKREARSVGLLHHPNIGTIFDMNEGDSVIFIAMEYLDGESLDKIIARRAAMPLKEKLRILTQCCRGLLYAHKNRVIHGDIKPGHIIVTRDGTVKVVDFGIMHLVLNIAPAGLVTGTSLYVSPEQLKGEPVDARSDIWSVGVVMYEFVAYQRPFESASIYSVVSSITTKDPTLLRTLVPDVPQRLEDVVSKCLRKNPEDRYQSIEDLLLDIEPLEQTLKWEIGTGIRVAMTGTQGSASPEGWTPISDGAPKPEPARRLRVFLCHSSGDKPEVRKLYRQLRDDGLQPWLDEEDILPGQNWAAEIPSAIRTCDVVVVCLSVSSVSKEGYLQKEIREALLVAEEKPEDTIFIIPVKLQADVIVPAHLSHWQWADLCREDGYDKLLRALRIRATKIGLTLPGATAQPASVVRPAGKAE